MFKKISLIIIAVMVTSCISLPEWTAKVPNDPGYYYGIGYSFTADRNNDYEQAMAKARTDLAASISAKVKSTTEVYTSSDGSSVNESFSQSLSQQVFSKLEQIEVVDSFYHKREGYWILIRLKKSYWDELKLKETKKLESDVNMLLSTLPENVAGKLQIFHTVKNKIDSSPFGVYAKISSPKGTFFAGAYMENMITVLSNQLSVQVNAPPFIYITETGNVKLNINSASKDLGRFEINAVFEDNVISSASTLNDGSAFINISAGKLRPGNNSVKYNFYVTTVNKSRQLVLSQPSSINVKKVPVNFFIQTNENIDLSFVKGRLEAISGFPFDLYLNNKGELAETSKYNMNIDFNFDILPQAYYGAPIYVAAQINIRLMKNGNLIFAYSKSGIRDGAQDLSGALTRTTQTVLSQIIRDNSFIKKLYKELGISSL